MPEETDDPMNLISGYCNEQLTPDEERNLFRAAAADQDIFDQLMEAEALRDALSSAEQRNRLKTALDVWDGPADTSKVHQAAVDQSKMRAEVDIPGPTSRRTPSRPRVTISVPITVGAVHHIGPYRVSAIQGGTGTVYLAERGDRKQVVIKLVSRHRGTEEALGRFGDESQVLASLHHPNIVQLLDWGTTEDGLSYMAMEYVKGVPIDTWCNRRRLPLRELLTLFRQVCAAVQWAHERMIIHRDIKPDNILVTDEGMPKLLDFGVSKLLEPDVAETTSRPWSMTPAYASPEQLRGERVGPASDIYALGVVLYQLLTGQLPYSVEGDDLRSVARAICEQEPIKPSVAIQRTQDEVGRKGAAGWEPPIEALREAPTGLRRRLAEDLDNIVLTALQKEPERRPSAAQFSEDLRRFLQDLSV